MPTAIRNLTLWPAVAERRPRRWGGVGDRGITAGAAS